MSDKPNEELTVAQKIDKVERRLGDVMNLLRAQSEVLKQRGMNLPSGAVNSLRQLKRQVGTLNLNAGSTTDELRSLRALADTTALINSSLDTDEVLNQVMDTVISLTGAERGYIVLKNAASGELEFRVARGMDAASLDSSKGLIVSKTIVNSVADSGEALLTDNASDDERFQNQQSIVGNQLRSILAVPLKVRDNVIGVVYCDNRVFSGLFKRSDLSTLEAFASQAAVAIENARLFENARLSLRDATNIRDRMQNIFTSVANGIITTDANGLVIAGNVAVEEILNENSVAGKVLNDVLPVLDDSFQNALTQVKNTDTQQFVTVYPVVEGLGEREWNVNIAPLMNALGEPAGVAMVIDDVTQERANESRILEARRYLPAALVESFRDQDILDVGAQEREITALFADVRGFTSFSEKLEPEELMRVINRYLSIASDAISLFEGIVDKYMGDAVTGLWNTQLNPQSDHAVRAVQAAMQLRLDLYALHEVMPDDERLFYGIGIHSGEAVLGNVGGAERREFSALGAATDICKYLQEQAGPGEVIISENTYELVQDVFECELQTEVVREKKGYEDIKFYKVLKRKKGSNTSSLFIDDELLDLLGDLDND